MAITKTGKLLIKLAMPRWKAVFQLLGNISQHALQQGKRPYAKPFAPAKELPAQMRERLNLLRNKYGPRNGIGIDSDSFVKEPEPLRLMKSDRHMLLGKMRGNKNKRDILGYYRADVSGMSQDDITRHAQNLYNSAAAHRNEADRLIAKNPARQVLRRQSHKETVFPFSK